VRPVHDDPGVFAHDLDPGGPGQAGEAPGHGCGADLDPPLGQNVEARQRDRRVVPLVGPEHRQGHFRPPAGPGLDRDPAGRGSSQRGFGGDVSVIEVDVDLPQGGAPEPGRPVDRGPGLVAPDPADGGPTPLEDPGLLAGDGAEGRAELAGVVEGDRGQDGQDRPDDVGRVEPAAHPDLQDHDPRAPAGEVEQAHRGGDLEEGRPPVPVVGVGGVQGGDGGPDGVDQADQLGGGRLGAVDPEPLLQLVQVWRAEQAGHHARGRERRGEHRGGRALPLGPGDVDDPERFVGVAQAPEEPAHPAQAKLGRAPGHPEPLVVEPTVEVIQAVLVVVGHGSAGRASAGSGYRAGSAPGPVSGRMPVPAVGAGPSSRRRATRSRSSASASPLTT